MTTTAMDIGQKELPAGWKWVKLGDVCGFVGGSQPPKSTFKYEWASGYVRLIQIQDYRTNENQVFIREADAKRFCTEADIMIARYGGTDTGKRSSLFRILRGLEGAYNVALVKTVISSANALDSEFLYWSLQQNYLKEAIVSESARAIQSGFRKEDLQKLPIALPPLEEQKRIAGILNEQMATVEEAKKAAQQRLEAAKALPAAYLREVFPSSEDELPAGWKWVKLGDVARFIDYRGKTPKKSDTGIRLITAKNVRKMWLDTFPEEFIPVNSYDSWMTRGFPQNGDVLFTTEAPLGNTAMVYFEEKFALAQRVVNLHPENGTSGKYLMYALNSPIFRNSVMERATGSTVLGIRAAYLKEVTLPFAPSHEQPVVAKYLDDKLAGVKLAEASIQQELDTIEAMPAALLRKAFSGGLI